MSSPAPSRVRPARHPHLGSAVALAPLAAHRIAEYLALRCAGATWRRVAVHTVPPLTMLAAAATLYRVVAPLPETTVGRSRNAPASLAVAAGLLLGTLAAVANLLSMLAAARDPAAGTLGVDPATAAMVLHVALLAPVAEEATFRGLLYRHLRQGLPAFTAALLAALLFSLMHGTLGQAVWTFLLGLVVAFGYEQTRSLWAPILIHALFNAVPVGVAVARSQPGDLGPLWLVVALVAVVFTIAARSAAQATRES
ncbi:MAG: CPBP family intramembrane metalloprotease [Deltaproteobacteria bacterium]|nr:CPBP family intramembrane metalloprotease [Deltaproteobacteria bacterium]